MNSDTYIHRKSQEGFDNPNLATVGRIEISLYPWSFIERCWQILEAKVSDVEVWVEQKEGKGINVMALRKRMNQTLPV
jgi:hypothetical protein